MTDIRLCYHPGMISWCGHLILLLSLIVPAQPESLRVVTAAEAESHLENKVEPIVPSIARTLRVGGTVKLHIGISALGAVSFIKVISGPPMLTPSAMDAVRKWKYKPFIEEQKPTAVETDVELFFPGGMSAAESATRNKFFPIEDECRRLLDGGKYADSERQCRKAIELSNELPKDAILERSAPRSLLGHSILLQGRVAEAVPLYEEALALDKGYRKPDDADLASDYANLARAYSLLGQFAKADGLYATSVQTFEAAIQSLPEMKENYSRRLKRTLNEYANLKEAAHDSAAAKQLRQKAATL